MNMNNIVIEALYEFKRSRRSILFRIFSFLAILGLIIYQFTFLSREGGGSINEFFRFYLDWPSQALASSIPFKSAYYFNFIQLLLVACFAVNDSREFRFSTKDALYTRAQGNNEIVAGRFLGRWLVITMLNWVSFVVAIVFNAVLYPRSFEVAYYFFYWLTLTFPSLVYFLGFSYLLTRFIRNQGISIIVLLVLLGGITLWGADFGNGVFDPCARHVPNMFSDFTGHVNLGNYLLQRGGILLAGFGFLVLSIVPFRRIPNSLRVARQCVSGAVVLFVLAGGMALFYLGRHDAIGNDRADYKAVYDKYVEQPKARVIKNDLNVKELANGGILVNCRMEIVNRNKIRVPLLVYLNPGLEVKSLEIDGSGVTFRREHQVLLPDKELSPGESCSVEVQYEGRIDDAVCFLDVASSRYNSPDVNRNGIYHYGYRPAFCEKEYKLLTPECIWYPVCLPPYSRSGYRGVNFTRYALKVEHDPGRTAVSQGNVTREGEGVTSFVVTHDMPGISLCIGEYEKREMTVFSQIPDDTTRVEVYYLHGHEYLLDKYDLPKEKVAEKVGFMKGNLELKECMFSNYRSLTVEENAAINAVYDGTQDWGELYRIQIAKRGFDPRWHYPYRSLTLLEVPCDFHCFPGLMQLSGEREQGGMVFIPEKLYSMKDYQFDIPRSDDEEAIEYELNRDVEKLLGQGSCDIKPTLCGKTTFVSSDEYPIMHDVWVDMARMNNRIREAFDATDNVRVIEYLKSHSFKDALYDPALSPDELRDIVRKKSEELYTYMLLYTDKEAFPQFYRDSIASNLFKEVPLEEYYPKIYKALGVRLDSLVEHWYHVDRLPLLDIREAQAVRIDEPPVSGVYTADPVDIVCRFKVFNRGDVQGLVKQDDGQAWVIPPHEGREIKARTRNYTVNRSSFPIATLLAQNLPVETGVRLEYRKIAEVDTTIGVCRLDSTMFFPSKGPSDEIIVDNDDPGFKVVRAKGFNLLSLFGKEESKKKYYVRGAPTESWVPVIHDDFYGFPVRSAFNKRAGAGKCKVEWSAELPEEGEYEVFFYHVRPDHLSYDPVQEFHYTVFDGQMEREVIIPVAGDEVGWISLGVFEFSGKDAKVTLSDKDRKNGDNKYERPQELVADAMKWVKL